MGNDFKYMQDKGREETYELYNGDCTDGARNRDSSLEGFKVPER